MKALHLRSLHLEIDYTPEESGWFCRPYAYGSKPKGYGLEISLGYLWLTIWWRPSGLP